MPKVEEGDATAVAVALADKLDTLVGFWAIGEKPTGSGDPYQLRRAALGVIRIVLENDLRVALVPTLDSARTLADKSLSLRGHIVRQTAPASSAFPGVGMHESSTSSPSSPTGSRSTCATRARGTT